MQKVLFVDLLLLLLLQANAVQVFDKTLANLADRLQLLSVEHSADQTRNVSICGRQLQIWYQFHLFIVCI